MSSLSVSTFLGMLRWILLVITASTVAALLQCGSSFRFILRAKQSSQFEESLGMDDNQLTELSEFPAEESKDTPGIAMQQKESSIFLLPDLQEFVERESQASRSQRRRGDRSQSNKSDERTGGKKISRKNVDEYKKAIELDPFADADERNFVEEYDIFQSILGQGNIIGIPIQYLQSGHLMLVLLSLLAAFVYDPANPLTNFPPEIRAFLYHGLKIIGTINCVLAIQAYSTARRRNLPAPFWVVKTLLLGGIASYELENVQISPTSATNVDDLDRNRSTSHMNK